MILKVNTYCIFEHMMALCIIEFDADGLKFMILQMKYYMIYQMCLIY